MRLWAILLLVPLAGCLGDADASTCDPVMPPRVGDAAEYNASSRSFSAFFTPTIRALSGDWIGGSGIVAPQLVGSQSQIRVMVVSSETGPEIAYTMAPAETPFAVEHFDADGRLQAASIVDMGRQYQRLDQGGMPAFFGAQWIWGLSAGRDWQADVRAHPYLQGTDDTITVEVSWERAECGGVLTVGPAAIDGLVLAVWGGWRTTFDEHAMPLRFEELTPRGEVVRTLERISVIDGVGPAIPTVLPTRNDPLALVGVADVMAQRPTGFGASMADAIAAIKNHPVGATFYAQNAAPGLYSFTHSPVRDGHWWGLEMYGADSGQLLDATVRFYPGGRPAAVDAATSGFGGDVLLFDGPVVSLEALSAWYAAEVGGTMDSVWCDAALFGMCVFGSGEAVGAAFDDGSTPGVVTGSGFGRGHRVNHETGIVADVKLR